MIGFEPSGRSIDLSPHDTSLTNAQCEDHLSLSLTPITNYRGCSVTGEQLTGLLQDAYLKLHTPLANNGARYYSTLSTLSSLYSLPSPYKLSSEVLYLSKFPSNEAPFPGRAPSTSY